MTLQEQNNLKTGDIFYFPELGPAQWEYKDGFMCCKRSYFMRTGHFLRMTYCTGPGGKRVKSARCTSCRDPFLSSFNEERSCLRVTVPIKLCCLDQDKLKALIVKIAKEEKKMLTEYAERQAERMKEQLARIKHLDINTEK